MSETNSMVAIYETDAESDFAVIELDRSGFDMSKVSLIGRGYHTSDQMAWRNIDSGIEPVRIGGLLVTGLMASLEEEAAVDGLTVIGTALLNLGIAKSTILRCESALRTDKSILVVAGTPGEVTKAKDLVRNTRPEEVSVHFATAAEVVPA